MQNNFWQNKKSIYDLRILFVRKRESPVGLIHFQIRTAYTVDIPYSSEIRIRYSLPYFRRPVFQDVAQKILFRLLWTCLVWP